MAIPPFDRPREHRSNIGRLLSAGAGWVVAAVAIFAVIVAKDISLLSAVRAKLPTVTWDRPAGPRRSAPPKREDAKAAGVPETAPQPRPRETPALTTPPPTRCGDSGSADTAPAIAQSPAPAKAASPVADATGAPVLQPPPAPPVASFEEASVTKRVAPEYPQLAREHRIEGQVVLRASVGADGRVRGVEILEGNPILAKAAADAMRQWRYEPARLNGIAVPTVVTTAMRFVFAA